MRAFALFAAALVACAAAHAQVQVNYQNPERFDEFAGPGKVNADGQRILDDLKTYIETQAAARLPAGQQLAVTITDLRRAGWVNPMFRNGESVRVVRDIDSPRLDLHFKLTGADGAVLKEGDAKLRDMAFLQRMPRPGASDALTFEKTLIDTWLTDMFGRS